VNHETLIHEVFCNLFGGALMKAHLLLRTTSIADASHCDAVCEACRKSMKTISSTLQLFPETYIHIKRFSSLSFCTLHFSGTEIKRKADNRLLNPQVSEKRREETNEKLYNLFLIIFLSA